ncbi:hypothetical protein AWZ03_004212 [Drosophila navojoa]|uniref:Kinesin-like protein KIF2A-like N-terminal domain-containing protein n=1 Tax=Drosophila navojoa TaxID=7232 RepID=A0A484BKZ4_DRONA|nr:hypothetical protein AWZ03_004212 [Drosophila navojoa]
MEFLMIGEKVNIGRTDGRIHAAVVDSKQFDIQSITVAWTEDSKLMGKEIPWSAIVALNPHLMERTQLPIQHFDDGKYNLSDVENMEMDECMDES